MGKNLNYKCKKCKSIEFKFEEITFSNNTKHRRKSCANCGLWVGYVAQVHPAEENLNFIMPFGRHKDKTLEQIYLEDPSYFKWAIRELKGSINLRFKSILKFKESV